MPPNIEDLVQELPVMKRRFALRPLDWVLVLDFTLLLVPLAVTLNNLLLDDDNVGRPLTWSSLLVMLFAAWLGKRQKRPLPPPSDNVLRRTIALSLLGVGAAVTLIGAVVFVFVTVNSILERFRDVPWFGVPLSALPVLLGHALMFGGAKIRVVPGRT